ncbi:MAG: putative zinc-binding protein [Armatimonadetes bacterium]|nr:putative zinc-binding protein [Armatimonadota bacterium]
MSEVCCTCEASPVLILACSGGSNVGQLANAAAVGLTREGKGKMYCLAGVGGHVDGIVESCKGASRLVVIDGCPVACAKKACAHAGVQISKYVEVTSLGIAKNYNLDLNESDVQKVIAACGL